MKQKITAYGSGIAVALIAATIFTITVGCVTALLLLVASVEEGVGDLSGSTLSITQIVVLLTQGVSIQAGTLSLSIIPLLLTALLIWLVVFCYSRITLSMRSFLGSTVTWLLVNALMLHNVAANVSDTLFMVLGKSTLLITVSFLIAAFTRSDRDKRKEHFLKRVNNDMLRRCLTIGHRSAVAIVSIFLLIAFIIVIAWVIRGRSNVVFIAQGLSMQRGSLILTTFLSLLWLPNFMIWSLAWMCGVGFHIGSNNVFTLWSANAPALPSIPVFGILPQALTSSWLILALLYIPIAIGLLISLFMLLTKRGFAILHSLKQCPSITQLVETFSYALGAFCLTAVEITIAMSALFALSNGSLGSDRLASIGVNIVEATRNYGRPTTIGIFLGLLTVLIIVLIRYLYAIALKAYQAKHPEKVLATFDHFEDIETGESPDSALSKNAVHDNASSRDNDSAPNNNAPLTSTDVSNGEFASNITSTSHSNDSSNLEDSWYDDSASSADRSSTNDSDSSDLNGNTASKPQEQLLDSQNPHELSFDEQLFDAHSTNCHANDNDTQVTQADDRNEEDTNHFDQGPTTTPRSIRSSLHTLQESVASGAQFEQSLSSDNKSSQVAGSTPSSNLPHNTTTATPSNKPRTARSNATVTTPRTVSSTTTNTTNTTNTPK